MSNKTQTRWLNEYLDGEIGLADKAELERQMAASPELRKEYTELRKIGLLMGTMPEVSVHPYRFRQNLSAAVESSESVYFTPQRAFAASMIFSLVIVCLTFGLFFYYQTVATGLPGQSITASGPSSIPAVSSDLTMDTGIAAEKFFDRLALESRIGLTDPGLMNIIVSQTTVFEGATCVRTTGLESTRFPAPLPLSVRIRVYPHQARDLAGVAQGLSGHPVTLEAQGSTYTVADILQQYTPRQQLTLCLKFN